MSLSPLDPTRGTGPLPALDAISQVLDVADKILDEAIAKLEKRERDSHGAGTEVLQDYEKNPYLIATLDENPADGETAGQLVIGWQPPGQDEAVQELEKDKANAASAAQEHVVLGATGTPVRVVGV